MGTPIYVSNVALIFSPYLTFDRALIRASISAASVARIVGPHFGLT